MLDYFAAITLSMSFGENMVQSASRWDLSCLYRLDMLCGKVS